MCSAAVVLDGGMNRFRRIYPSLVVSHPPPSSTALLDASFLDSLAGLSIINPIQNLRERQDKLVQAVWFGATDPSDEPLPIVSDFLYLASCHAATRRYLKLHNITHVIRLGWGFPTYCTHSDGVEYHDFPIMDSPTVNIRFLFEETTTIIEAARLGGESVLVHCHAGVSRSSTIVLAYMIKYMKMPLDVAWNTAYKIRPIIRPNSGFAEALQQYEMEQLCVSKSSMPIFWMSDSYLYYIDYIDMMYRLAGLDRTCGRSRASVALDTLATEHLEQMSSLRLREQPMSSHRRLVDDRDHTTSRRNNVYSIKGNSDSLARLDATEE
ncbi:hypothetical protein BASA62_006111 [Batrachochytrium salamandrivorans]|nr:hypothetical protein BASA62_006111 [Batrachochytrium salamandrivorans]